MRPARLAVRVALAAAALTAPEAAWAGTPAAAAIAAIAPAAVDDARQAVVIGTDGEIYQPDGRGAWVRRLPSRTAGRVVAAGRAGASVVAAGDGVVYRLADNGWSVIRLAQRGKAILGAGNQALAAVGRQLFALDPLTRGEPTRLAVAPAAIVAIAAGPRAVVVATDTGVWKLARRAAGAAGGAAAGPLVPVRGAPKRPRLISDRWAIGERGAVDLATGAVTAWPGDLAIGVAAPAADESLAAVGAGQAGLELLTLRGRALTRDPLGVTGQAVGVVVDRAGRAVVALADGRIALRDPSGWSTTEVTDEADTARPGPPPATSR